MSSSNNVKYLAASGEHPEGNLFLYLLRGMWVPLLSVGIVVSIGVLGYMFIEGWNAFDSLYMTVITLATIGFGETHPLSQSGRLFTIILIVAGIGVLTVVFTAITQRIIQRQFLDVFQRKKMYDAINRLQNHTVMCGFGRIARIAAEELKRSNTPLVVIDSDPEKVQNAQRDGYLALQGDATLEETLLEAGIERASHLVSLLPKDSDNLYVILTSRELKPSLFIVSRAEDEGDEKRLRRAGADRIMSPYRVGGLKIAGGLLRPYVTDFLDLASSTSSTALQIEELQIPDSSPLNGVSLQEAALRKKTNVIVAAIISRGGEMLFNPAAETVIESGSTFIALGKRDDLTQLEKLLLGERV